MKITPRILILLGLLVIAFVVGDLINEDSRQPEEKRLFSVATTTALNWIIVIIMVAVMAFFSFLTFKVDRGKINAQNAQSFLVYASICIFIALSFAYNYVLKMLYLVVWRQQQEEPHNNAGYLFVPAFVTTVCFGIISWGILEKIVKAK